MSAMASSSSPPPSSAYGGDGPLILGIPLAECLLCTIMMAFRVWSTVRKVVPPSGSSLYWAGAAWLVSFISNMILLVSVSYGIGNHAAVLTELGTLNDAFKFAWTAMLIALIAIGLGKCAAVSFLLSVQGPVHPKGRIFLIVLAALNVAIDVACVLEIAFHCTPTAAYWDPTAGVCYHPDRNLAVGYFTGSWNAATDLTLAVYPIFLFWNMQLKKSIKLGLCLLLGLGVFAAVCSAVKTWQVSAILDTTDPSYQVSALVIWTITEMWIVLILASVAPLWPVIRKLWKRGCSSNDFDGSQAERGEDAKHNHPNSHRIKRDRLKGDKASNGAFVELTDTYDPEAGQGGQARGAANARRDQNDRRC